MQMTSEEIWSLLEEVKDPEIPVVSIVEMGIARQVEVEGYRVRVTLTPTFSGCPAIHFMKSQIEQRLLQAGLAVEVVFRHDPAWSSNWMTPEARRKLKDFGLAPPPIHEGNFEAVIEALPACPYCGSTDTHLENSFGPTLCRSIYTCRSCLQPFEQFKPL